MVEFARSYFDMSFAYSSKKTMSKVSFRARALDASKPMPVYKAFEIPDMKDFAQINRSVPQMPTGMEKEEETEHHLQRALSAQQVYGSSEVLVIPIPEVHDVSKRFHVLYPDTYKLSKQYIHVQALSMDQEIPDYDMDSDDDLWLNQQKKKFEITPLKFEEMMDRLEKGCGQQMVTLPEAKLLLKEDDDLIIAVYNYWLNKRLKMQQPLIVTVKTERRDGTTSNNPYVAFRRRTEKMQTRKNRKNDEVSYEKMLKLHRDLQKTLTLLELLKRREKSKKEMLQLTIEVAEKRNEMDDFSGVALAQAEEEREKHPTFVPPFALNGHGEWMQTCNGEELELSPVRKKRRYRKRKHSQLQSQIIPHINLHQLQQQHQQSSCDVDMDSSDEDVLSASFSQSDHEDENDPDGMFAFKRRHNCYYHQPVYCGLDNWPKHRKEESRKDDSKFCFSLTSLPTGYVGYARRRVGRGGRVILDRGSMPCEESLEKLKHNYNQHHSNVYSDYIIYVRDSKGSSYQPRSHPEDRTLSTDASNQSGKGEHVLGRQASDYDVEGFQSHQEQLLDMQREQEKKLFVESEHNAAVMLDLDPALHLGDRGSRFTLDSASAEFAVQALVGSTPLVTLPVLEGTTPSSFGTAASSPVGSRTGLQQLNTSMFNKVVDSVRNNGSNVKTVSSMSSITQRHPGNSVTAEPSIISGSCLSSSPSLISLQKKSPLLIPQMTSLLQPVISSNASLTLASPSHVSSKLSSSSTTFLLSKTNGSLLSSKNVKFTGLSTSGLQLNLPSSSSSLITLTSSPLLTSLPSQPSTTVPQYPTTPAATTPTTAVTALQLQSSLKNKVIPGCSTSNFYKLPTSAPISNFDILRPNHDEILFGKDTGIPMDVT